MSAWRQKKSTDHIPNQIKAINLISGMPLGTVCNFNCHLFSLSHNISYIHTLVNDKRMKSQTILFCFVNAICLITDHLSLMMRMGPRVCKKMCILIPVLPWLVNTCYWIVANKAALDTNLCTLRNMLKEQYKIMVLSQLVWIQLMNPF